MDETFSQDEVTKLANSLLEKGIASSMMDAKEKAREIIRVNDSVRSGKRFEDEDPVENDEPIGARIGELTKEDLAQVPVNSDLNISSDTRPLKEVLGEEVAVEDEESEGVAEENSVSNANSAEETSVIEDHLDNKAVADTTEYVPVVSDDESAGVETSDIVSGGDNDSVVDSAETAPVASEDESVGVGTSDAVSGGDFGNDSADITESVAAPVVSDDESVSADSSDAVSSGDNANVDDSTEVYGSKSSEISKPEENSPDAQDLAKNAGSDIDGRAEAPNNKDGTDENSETVVSGETDDGYSEPQADDQPTEYSETKEPKTEEHLIEEPELEEAPSPYENDGPSAEEATSVDQSDEGALEPNDVEAVQKEATGSEEKKSKDSEEDEFIQDDAPQLSDVFNFSKKG